MSDFYDRQGKPLELMAWARLHEDNAYKIVKQDRIGEEPDDVLVSTVWLGSDHRFGGGPPLIFETMIFGGEHGDYQERFSTEAEALDGHARALSLVRAVAS